MELRTLRYLQALAQEGSISNAAKSLHITQPTLSRQLASLEEELGCELFIRTYKGMELSDQGVMLLRYADSILELAEKAQDELSLNESTVAGTVHIGAGETMNMIYVAAAIAETRRRYPKVDFQLHSGASLDLLDGFARGAYDFFIECEVGKHVEANVIELPIQDRWGALVTRESKLAVLDRIKPENLEGHTLVHPRQALKNGTLTRWAGSSFEHYDICAGFNLPLNASILAREGLGVQLTYEGLFETSESTDLVFIPLHPLLASKQGLVWRKTPLSKQAAVFLEVFREKLAQNEQGTCSSFIPGCHRA